MTTPTNRREFLRSSAGFGTLVLGGLPVLRAQSALAAEPIKIGFLTVLSGPFSPIGLDMLRGAQLKIKEVGSVGERKLELLQEDTEAKPEIALRKADRLVNKDGVQVLLGVFSSGEIVALAGMAPKLGVPILTTNTATARATGELCNRYLFRSNANDGQLVRAGRAWLEQSAEARKGNWYILAHDYEWGRGSAAAFKNQIAKALDVRVVGEDYAPLDTKDWATYIGKIKAAKADFVWAPIIVAVVTDFVKQAREFGLLDSTRVMAVAGITDSQLQAVGEAATGMMTVAWATWMVNTPESQRFNEAFWREYKAIPGFQSAVTYAGTGLLLSALERAGGTAPDRIIAALEGASFAGPYGRLQMRKEDHQALTPVFIGRVDKAPANAFGAKMAVHVVLSVGPEKTTVPLAETGCKGL